MATNESDVVKKIDCDPPASAAFVPKSILKRPMAAISAEADVVVKSDAPSSEVVGSNTANYDVVSTGISSSDDAGVENAEKKPKLDDSSEDVIDKTVETKAKTDAVKSVPSKNASYSLPAKNSIAILYEYQSGIDFKVVTQSIEQNVPYFTMTVEVDGKSYEATGTSKKQAKNDLADKVVADIGPQIEAYHRKRDLEQWEQVKAHREFIREQDQQRKAKAGYDGGDWKGDEGPGQMLCEDEKINNFTLRPKTSLQVMSELNMYANYSEPREEDITSDDGTVKKEFVVEVEVQEQKFEGRGSTAVLAKAIAAERALIMMFNIDFVRSESGYPMYAGDPNQFKKLKALYMNPMAPPSKPTQLSSSALDSRESILLVDGRNPVQVLNELFNGLVRYETFGTTDDEGAFEQGVTATMEGLTIVGKGATIKAAKNNAAVAALAELKSNGTLARIIQEKEQKISGRDRKKGSLWKTDDGDESEELFPLEVSESNAADAVPLLNSLAKLNQLYPGLDYKISSGSRDPGNPWFHCAVWVERKKFRGQGRSKKLARYDAAESALRTLDLWSDEDEMVKAQSSYCKAETRGDRVAGDDSSTGGKVGSLLAMNYDGPPSRSRWRDERGFDDYRRGRPSRNGDNRRRRDDYRWENNRGGDYGYSEMGVGGLEHELQEQLVRVSEALYETLRTTARGGGRRGGGGRGFIRGGELRMNETRGGHSRDWFARGGNHPASQHQGGYIADEGETEPSSFEGHRNYEQYEGPQNFSRGPPPSCGPLGAPDQKRSLEPPAAEGSSGDPRYFCGGDDFNSGEGLRGRGGRGHGPPVFRGRGGMAGTAIDQYSSSSGNHRGGVDFPGGRGRGVASPGLFPPKGGNNGRGGFNDHRRDVDFASDAAPRFQPFDDNYYRDNGGYRGNGNHRGGYSAFEGNYGYNG